MCCGKHTTANENFLFRGDGKLQFRGYQRGAKLEFRATFSGEGIMGKTAIAGDKGPTVRSDCLVTLEMRDSGGLEIELISKLETLYGDALRALCQDVLNFFEVKHAKLQVDDSGAIDCVLAARIEAVVKQCIETRKEYLLDILPENQYHTKKDRYRRSRLYLPGNTPKFMINAGIHHPDGIILDLEDSVAPDKKAEARILVRNALRGIDFYGAERMVRINQIPKGLEDLDYIVPHHVNLILIPKCETADQIHQVDERIARILQEKNVDYPIYFMPIIESALGVVNAYQIASASKNVVALAIGLEDYTADLGTQRTKEGRETFFARCQVVNAARAAGVQPIDSVFSDISDMDALRDVVLESKSLGFDGMGCIHPRQIPMIHEYYAPNDQEIEKAKKIVRAFDEASAKGLGVVSLGSKMIDPPVVKRAQRTIALAINAGKLAENWKNSDPGVNT
ncbi:HpcH/HpaI aldolase [Candidatus Vecturithrix granuli]|uniref:HpcH/HpaI aldolase n=1 Tax=Vecturithrix granuli TaxID=1499967 RepID=A0A081C5C3_VECG1|nr:HpcH/HpaI aldolase [Candidatus Vecturithrix granuli]